MSEPNLEEAIPQGWYLEAPTSLAIIDGLSSMPTPGEDGYRPDGPLSQVGALSSDIGSGAGAGGTADKTATQSQEDPSYAGVVTLLVGGIFLFLICRTRLGYVIVYYCVALTILFILLTNAQWIYAVFKPLDQATAGIGIGN